MARAMLHGHWEKLGFIDMISTSAVLGYLAYAEWIGVREHAAHDAP